MALDDAGSDDVEQRLVGGNRLGILAVAGAQRQVAAVDIAHAQLGGGDVAPAEAAAIAGAERIAGKQIGERVADRLHVAVLDALHVQRQGQVVGCPPGRAKTIVGRHVEVTLFGEQPLVLVETAHAHLGGPGRAQRQRRRYLAGPAQAHAEAGAAVGAAVGQIERVAGGAGKSIRALHREALIAQVRGNAESVLRVEFPGQRRRDEELFEVHVQRPRRAKTGKGIVGVIGIHAAVAIHGDPCGQFG